MQQTRITNGEIILSAVDDEKREHTLYLNISWWQHKIKKILHSLFSIRENNQIKNDEMKWFNTLVTKSNALMNRTQLR